MAALLVGFWPRIDHDQRCVYLFARVPCPCGRCSGRCASPCGAGRIAGACDRRRHRLARAAPLPTDEGTWSHAYVAFGGTPKYPKDFKAFEWVNPDAPRGGTVYLGNPDRRTSFDKFNPYTIKGSPPTGVSILMFEPLAVRSGDEPGTIYGLLAEGIKVAPDKSSVTFRLNPKAQVLQRRPRHRRRREALLRDAHEQGRRPRRARRTRQGQVRRDRRRAHDPLRPRGTHRRHGVQHRRHSGVFAQVGQGARRQDQAARRDRHGIPDHHGPVHHRQDRLRPWHRVQAQSRLLGPGSQCPQGDVQLRPRGVPALSRPCGEHGGIQGGRVRPDPGVRGIAIRARPRGRQVARRPHRQEDVRIRHGAGLPGVSPEPAPPDLPGHPRPRGARLHLRLREDQPLRPAPSRVQPLLQFRFRRQGKAEPGRA